MFRLICLILKKQKASFCIRQLQNHSYRPANYLNKINLNALTGVHVCRFIQISLNRRETGQRRFYPMTALVCRSSADEMPGSGWAMGWSSLSAAALFFLRNGTW